jgi:hypothetical protein
MSYSNDVTGAKVFCGEGIAYPHGALQTPEAELCYIPLMLIKY